jgi:hypothetical protein
MDQQHNNTPDAMDVGIPISLEEFRALITKYIESMESGRELSATDYLTMTRLWNTILFRRLESADELFHRYAKAFFPEYIEPISKSLNAQPTKGMALYSKEHDIYIGGKPHHHSQFKF